VNNEKPVLIQNQFGGAFGGPIVKNTAFFFMDYEGFRRMQKRPGFSSLPTMEQRQGILGIPVPQPYTGEIYQNGTIPQTQITRFAAKCSRDCLRQTCPGTRTTSSGSRATTNDSDKGDVRYDQYLGTRVNFFARYSHRELNQEIPAVHSWPLRWRFERQCARE
jgi:hypothetical protein